LQSQSILSMTPCKHTRWLRLSRKDHGFVLETADRAQRLLDNLPRPEEQCPSFITLIGNHTKLQVLRELGIANTGGKRGHGEIHLSIVPSTERTDCPTLVADGDISSQNKLGKPLKPQLCHEIDVRPFPSDLVTEKPIHVADRIHYRAIFPFTDVLCFFATDLGGIERVVQHLARWVDGGRPSTMELRPWLVVVVEDGVEEDVLTTFWDLIHTETTIDIMDMFGGIRIISLSRTRSKTGRRRSRRGPWDTLTQELLSLIQLPKLVRARQNCLFSAQHLAGFLCHAAVCTTDAPREPFDFILSSRSRNPVASDLDIHLSQFLEHITSVSALRTFAIPMIASSLNLDHYPPGMHRKRGESWSPAHVSYNG
jgi:hypothetical protein